MILNLIDKFNFGKYKDETVEWVYKNDRKYIAWIVKNKIRDIEFCEDIKLTPFDFGFSGIRNTNSYTPTDIYSSEKDYSQDHFDLIDSGDYYPSGCDIYNLG